MVFTEATALHTSMITATSTGCIQLLGVQTSIGHRAVMLSVGLPVADYGFGGRRPGVDASPPFFPSPLHCLMVNPPLWPAVCNSLPPAVLRQPVTEYFQNKNLKCISLDNDKYRQAPKWHFCDSGAKI